MKASPPPRRLLLLAASTLAILLIATATKQTGDWVEKIQVQNGQEFLKALRNTTSEALRVWKSEELNTLEYWAGTKQVQLAAQDLVGDFQKGESLSESQGLTKIRDWYEDVGGGHAYEGFFIVGPGNTNLGSSRDEDIGMENVMAANGTLLAGAWSGKPFCSSPIRSSVELAIEDGRMVEGRATMLCGTGITDENGDVFALLLIRINPYKTLFPLLEQSRPSQSGETFLFNGKGEVASHSRFLNSYHERADGKVVSFFSSIGLSVAQRRVILQPLINAKRTGPDSRFSTMGPFLNCRGEAVVGAWEWNEDIQMGLVVEISEAEAYQPIWGTRKALNIFGIIAGFAIMVTMITHQVWHIKEKERRRSLEREVALNHMKSDFLARMSHEIRTPMNGVLGMLECLSDSDLDEEQADRVGTALTSASSLLAILNDILDLSKIESGEVQYCHENFNLHKMAKDVVHLFEDKAKERNNNLKLNWDSELANTFIGDGVRISQVLINLLSNASKFTKDGDITLSVSQTETAGVLSFEVKDSGVGISDERMEAIFGEFIQADTSISRNYGGTGLGLAIVKRLVDGMDGEVGVRSSVGVGSTFYFTLPLQAGEGIQSASGSTIAAPLGKAAKLNMNGLRALVVDDNKINLKVAKAFLLKFGCQVQLVESGQDAVDLFAAETFDVIFMDIQMPGIDGFEATRLIRSMPGGSDIHIVALTAHALPEYQQRCDEAGMNNFLAKPIRKETLAEMLSHEFPKWESTDEPESNLGCAA